MYSILWIGKQFAMRVVLFVNNFLTVFLFQNYSKLKLLLFQMGPLLSDRN
jgi:hypothetical protein